MRTCNAGRTDVDRDTPAANGRGILRKRRLRHLWTVVALLLAGAVSGCSGPKANQAIRISDNLLLYWDGGSQTMSAHWGGFSFAVDTSCVAIDRSATVSRSPTLSRGRILRPTGPIIAADATDVDGVIRLHVVWQQKNGATTHALS
ncbi:MAG: hypothetical protein EB075_07530, partial [Bacteroidetes bacterium]|nr:hypothetical protein [Bacteroidota bacterium]